MALGKDKQLIYEKVRQYLWRGFICGVQNDEDRRSDGNLRNHFFHMRSVYHAVDIGVFGSCVTGNLKKHSDIDVLVSFEKGRKDLFNYMRLKQYLEGLLGRKVDLVMKEAVKPRLRERIFSEVRHVLCSRSM